MANSFVRIYRDSHVETLLTANWPAHNGVVRGGTVTLTVRCSGRSRTSYRVVLSCDYVLELADRIQAQRTTDGDAS